jgi:hypothetical protein
MHVPPLRHGISRHSLRSTHPFPSGETTIPSPQLKVDDNNVDVDDEDENKNERTLYKLKCKSARLRAFNLNALLISFLVLYKFINVYYIYTECENGYAHENTLPAFIFIPYVNTFKRFRTKSIRAWII